MTEDEIEQLEEMIQQELPVREFLADVVSGLGGDSRQDALRRTEFGDASLWMAASVCLLLIVKTGVDYVRQLAQLDLVRRRNELAEEIRQQLHCGRKEAAELVQRMLDDIRRQPDDGPLIQAFLRLRALLGSRTDDPRIEE